MRVTHSPPTDSFNQSIYQIVYNVGRCLLSLTSHCDYSIVLVFNCSVFMALPSTPRTLGFPTQTQTFTCREGGRGGRGGGGVTELSKVMLEILE